jgi:hypothetical protein
MLNTLIPRIYLGDKWNALYFRTRLGAVADKKTFTSVYIGDLDATLGNSFFHSPSCQFIADKSNYYVRLF